LNNKTFGEARDKLIMNEEFQGTYNVTDSAYPTTWVIASNYFRLIKDNLPKERTRQQESSETALATTYGTRPNGQRRPPAQSKPTDIRQSLHVNQVDVNQRSRTRSGTQYMRSNRVPEYQGPRHDFEMLHHDSYYTNRRRNEEVYYPYPTYVDRHYKQVPVPTSVPEYAEENGQRRRLTQFDRSRIAAETYNGKTVGEAITNYRDQVLRDAEYRHSRAKRIDRYADNREEYLDNQAEQRGLQPRPPRRFEPKLPTPAYIRNSRAYLAKDTPDNQDQDADDDMIEDEGHEQAYVTVADLAEVEHEARKLNNTSAYLAFHITNHKTSNHDLLIFDPGATHHVICDKTYLHNIHPTPTIPLHGIGVTSKITHQGDLHVFGNALYHPTGQYNLLSQRQLLNQGFTIYFDNKLNQYELNHPQHETVTFTCNRDGLYRIPITSVIPIYCHDAKAYLTMDPKKLSKREKAILNRAYLLHHQLVTYGG
jgi:hypothetical protein